MWWFVGCIILFDLIVDNFLSCVGVLDFCCDLYVDMLRLGKVFSIWVDGVVFLDENVGLWFIVDVCVMVVKLVYENLVVVKWVVKDIWMMNFVKFYECWNGEYNFVCVLGLIWMFLVDMIDVWLMLCCVVLFVEY